MVCEAEAQANQLDRTYAIGKYFRRNLAEADSGDHCRKPYVHPPGHTMDDESIVFPWLLDRA